MLALAWQITTAEIFTCMMRDLNLLQKCLMFVNNGRDTSGPIAPAKTTMVSFFLNTLISKIHEMWEFLNNNKVIKDPTKFSDELKATCDEIKQFFSDKKNENLSPFIRHNFGFHYAYNTGVDQRIEDASNLFSEFDMWLSIDDSGNEIFSSSNAVILAVIFSEMKRLGFSGDEKSLMNELFGLTLRGAQLFRKFSVLYLVEVFEVKWDKREEAEIDVPEIPEVKLPLIVAL